MAVELERWGIPTTMQIYLREAAERLRPPRALLVPFDHGYALGEPHNEHLQLDILRETLSLLDSTGPAPLLVDYVPERHAVGSAR